MTVINIIAQQHRMMLPLFFVHGFLVRGTVFLWQNRRTDLSTNILDATLDLTAACSRLGEDALNSGDSVSVSVTVCVHVLQPGRRQRVLLGWQLLVELYEERQHALADLQDLRHQLRCCAWWNPACRGAFGPDNLGSFRVIAVDNFLELPSAFGYEAENLSFSQILSENRVNDKNNFNHKWQHNKVAKVQNKHVSPRPIEWWPLMKWLGLRQAHYTQRSD